MANEKYVVICAAKNGDGHLYLERGEFSWVDTKVCAAIYSSLDAARTAADRVNLRSANNDWRTEARAVRTS